MNAAATRLLGRLDAIGRALADDPAALALLALGSVGRERERIDRYSDLDFFVIVAPGAKQRYLSSLDWLASVQPIAWSYRNTVDGHKALYADGIFCELAIFEPDELARIPYSAGRTVWRRDGFDESLLTPRHPPPPPPRHDEAWLVGELLSCLYVGVGRWRRGERLAGQRLIEAHALDRLLELAARDGEAAAARDGWAPERRAEQRLPALAPYWTRFLQGYERVPASALAMLDWLEQRGPVAPAMASIIRAVALPREDAGVGRGG